LITVENSLYRSALDLLRWWFNLFAVCGMVPLSSLESLKQWAMKFHAHLFEESTPKSQSEQIALSWLIDLFLFTCIHW